MERGSSLILPIQLSQNAFDCQNGSQSSINRNLSDSFMNQLAAMCTLSQDSIYKSTPNIFGSSQDNPLRLYVIEILLHE